MDTTKKSKVKYARPILVRPTFEGKKKLTLAAKVNEAPLNTQGGVMRRLIERGISEDGKLLL